MDIRSFFRSKDTESVEKFHASENSVAHEDSNKPVGNGVKRRKFVVSEDDSKENIKESENSKNPSLQDSVSSDSLPKAIRDIVTWEIGGKVPYMALVSTFERIEAVTSRLEKESLFCNLFRAIILTSPQELEAVVYLASNSIYPAYDGLELGIGDALLIKAVVEATGREKSAVKAAYDKDGDLGTVASLSRTSQSTLGFASKPKPLMTDEVLEELRNITRTTGSKAMDRKVAIIKKMMIRCQRNEAKYLVRSLQGKLRIGTAFQTVLVSLAQAFALSPTPEVRSKLELAGVNPVVPDTMDDEEAYSDEDENTQTKTNPVTEEQTNHTDNADDIPEDPPTSTEVSLDTIDQNALVEPEEAKKLRCRRQLSRSDRLELSVIAVKRAFSESPSITSLVTALLNTPLHQLYIACRLKPGIPVAPMLAKPTKALDEVLKRLSGQLFTMEFKYDGERAQVT